MKKTTLSILLGLLLCPTLSIIGMSAQTPGSAAVLAELMATIKRRKSQKKLEKRLALRREVIVDSDTDTQPDDSDFITSATIPTPPLAPFHDDVVAPSTKCPSPSSDSSRVSSSEEDTLSSSDEEKFTSDLSDIEEATTFSEEQKPYSTGLLGESIACATGFITHFQKRMQAHKPLENCYSHSVNQSLDTVMLALSQDLERRIAQQNLNDNASVLLQELDTMDTIIQQLNHLKTIANFHHLSAQNATIKKAISAAENYELYKAATKQKLIREIESHDSSLNELWGTDFILNNAKQLKHGRVGRPANSAAMDVAILATAQKIGRISSENNSDAFDAMMLQAGSLMRILKGKKFPLNPYTVKQLFEELIELESKIAHERKETEERLITKQYTIERLADKLAAYVEQEAHEHTLSKSSAEICPDSDAKDA